MLPPSINQQCVYKGLSPSCDRCHMMKMSEVSKAVSDIGTIWNRLFDHRSFLCGEINFALQEFEQKRSDTEVDNLFKSIENITDIKDTELDRFKQAVDQFLPETNNKLEQALTVCNKFADLENKYKEVVEESCLFKSVHLTLQEFLLCMCDHLQKNRHQRKQDWESFMDYITTSYSEINSLTESKEEDLQKVYSQLEEKLHI